ncbi:MAG: response regulator [Candidatus Aminicenantales bacterium]
MAEKKILIVDYDSQSLQALSSLFRPHNFQILTATDGVSAYEKFVSEKPDLVLMEAILPKLHGFDLTKKITQESRGSVPVIIVTGLYKGPQYRHEALANYGASEYFEKPYDQGKLINSVLSLLKEKVDIWLELPDPDTVVEHLARRLKSPSRKT